MIETQRLASLHSYQILDTPPEPEFDDITRLLALICRVPFALISFIDQDRQWFKSAYGVDMKETPRTLALCNHTIQKKRPFLVKDLSQDPRFSKHPFVVRAPAMRFYVGIPLFDSSGNAIGSLCALDTSPRELTLVQMEMLESLANHVMQLLENRKKNADTRAMHHTFSAVTQNIHDGLVLEDSGRNVILCNRSFARIFGCQTTVHLLGKNILHTLDWLAQQGFSHGMLNPGSHSNHCIQMQLTCGKTIEVRSKPIFVDRLDGPRVWIFREVS